MVLYLSKQVVMIAAFLLLSLLLFASAAEPPRICPSDSSGDDGVCTPTASNNAMFTWIESQKGGYVNKQLNIKGNLDNNGLRGVYWNGPATSEGISLFRIPQSCFLTSKSLTDPRSVFGKSKAIPQSLLQQIQSESTQFQLAIVLMAELGSVQDSYWKSYLELLPENDPNQPLFWKEYSALQSPLLAQGIQGSLTYLESKKPLLDQLIDATRSKMFPPQIFKLFLWCFYLVSSRAFQFTIDGTSMHAMVPLADLMNHGFAASNGFVEVVNSNLNGVDMATAASSHSLSNGDELFVEYQKNAVTSTAEFLYRYGIVNPEYATETEGDYVILRYGTTSYTVFGDGSVGGGDLTLLPTLSEKINTAIDALPTSLQEDQQALSSITTTNKNALLIRIRYKQVLQKLQAWIEKGATPSAAGAKSVVESSKALYFLNIPQ